jgi:pyridoxine 5-phosphate synthase
MDGAHRTLLSVNLNKVALVRNSRGGERPSVVEAARIALAAGAEGLTLHPRLDERHATLRDVADLGALPQVRDGHVELNIEGDFRPPLAEAARAAGAKQFTIVPVAPGEITTQRGWKRRDGMDELRRAVEFFAPRARVSVFVDAEEEGIRMAADAGAGAVEFHTKEYAETFGTPQGERVLDQICRMGDLARSLGLRVNAGHDLDTRNLPLIIRRLRPDEVSIGHALISDAIEVGLPIVTRRFLDALSGGGGRA